jgi:hypothetical protein
MSIRYDAERGSFVDGKRYVPPAVVAKKLAQVEAERDRLQWIHQFTALLDVGIATTAEKAWEDQKA